MRSVRLQLLMTVAATAVAAGWLACRGLPPEMDLLRATHVGDMNLMRRCLTWNSDQDQRTVILTFFLGPRPGGEVRSLDAGSTALHIAAWNGSTDAVRLLLSHGCDVDARSDDGHTPLHMAAEEGFVNAAAALLDAHAAVDARTKQEETALELAARHGRGRVVGLLVDRGAEVNARLGTRGTALHAAANYDCLQAAEVLVAHGAELNAQDEWGDTPLYLASRQGNREIAKLLLARGADVRIRNCCGETPLHIAAEMLALSRFREKTDEWPYNYSDFKAITSMLLEAGSDPNVRNEEGRTVLLTALWWCAEREFVERLITHGADVNAADSKGHTPLFVASRGEQQDVVALLREHGAVD